MLKLTDHSITDIAKGAGISRPTVYNFISGKVTRQQTIKKIQAYLNKENKMKYHDLAKLRRHLNISQKECAEIMEISQPSLSRLEATGIAEDSKYYDAYKKLLASKVNSDDLYLFLEEMVFCDDPIASPSDAIRLTRRDQKLSQSAFAKAVGISQPFLCQLENGQRAVTVHQLTDFFNRLNFGIDYLNKLFLSK